ncbi:MAG: two-component system response regulator CreB [Devosia sp. 67-54]|uniref:response regulator transcription factor n=1 Tax=unclassified Devosia TaxID=196773 RepID=UPI00096724D4|nr:MULTISPECIES: response regulator transcription factor [unclassified Devosia]MBN9304005.1 response regulator transcription factor [Devosia sp.]OJX17847.1 MAG: two-component system response regulator CreB [Devosia sp. 67-54]
MPRILIADDEPNIREVISFALERAGFAVATARNGSEALQQLRRGQIDLIVLDIGMPEMDGLEVCRQVRKSSDVPILFLSARDEEIDRVLGLEIGGDDYVTKPFSARELVARVNVILKRARNGVKAPATASHGRVRLDASRHGVWFGDTAITLTALEFEILAAFMARPEVVFSREQIMEAAYGGGTFVSDRTIDSHIRNLRAKFAEAGCSSIVETVHGVGFRLGAAG